MDINKLHSLLPDMATFVCVVETGSFTAAANQLGITPSAISRQISRLEKALSLTLLERTTRKQFPSDSGKLAYISCRALVDNAKDVANISDVSQREAKGDLYIAVPKAFAKQVLEPLLLTFMHLYPLINVHLKITDLFIDPINGEVDMIFRLTNTPIENLVSKKLGTVRSILCASPDYLAKHSTPLHPQQLTRHSCLYLGENPKDREWHFDKKGQAVKVVVEGRYSANHTEMRLNAAKAGFGIAIFPDFTVTQALKNKELVQVLGDWDVNGSYQGVINLQYASRQFMPTKMRVFIDFMEDNMINKGLAPMSFIPSFRESCKN
jgi:DNA-binding transcriptional LysR family regulator